MRTRERASREYERSWERVRTIVDGQIAAGTRDPIRVLDEVWATLSRGFLVSPPLRDYYAQVGVRLDRDETPLERVAVRDGSYRLVPFDDDRDDTVISTVVAFVAAHRDSIDCVVELGSGFGRNLFYVDRALRNGSQEPIELHACELTRAGREVTRTLHRLDLRTNLSVHSFDYHAPDLSFLGCGRKVLFFSAHSVEQIPTLSRAVFEEMLARSPDCRCFHLEPVGWQYDSALVEWRRARAGALAGMRRFVRRQPRKFLRALGRVLGTRLERGYSGIRLRREDIDRADRVSRNAAAWSLRGDYNRNLVSLLRELEAEKRITIEELQLNTVGENPFNPTTMIRWAGTGDRPGRGV